MGKGSGSIEIGLVTDIGEFKAQMDLGADAVSAFKDKSVTSLQQLNSVSAAAFGRIGTEAKEMAAKVSEATLRAATALTAFRKAQQDVRDASLLVKKATGEDLPAAMRVLGSTEQIAAAAARELAEAEAAAGVGAAALGEKANEARGALALMGDELGVKINRHMKGFIADLPVVGALLNTAFSAFAVIGLVEILAQVPEAIDKIVEKLSGWDKAAKAEYETEIRLNHELVKAIEEREIKQHHLSEVTLSGSKKIQEEIKNIGKDIDTLNKNYDVWIARQLELAKIFEGTHLETMRVSTGRGGTEKQQVEVSNKVGVEDIEQKQKDWDAAKEAVVQYGKAIADLKAEKLPELKLSLGPEQAREAERAGQKIQQLETKTFEFEKRNLEAAKNAADQVSKSRQSAAERDLELTIKGGEAKQKAAEKEIDVNNLVIDGVVQHAKAEYEIKKESLDLQVAQRKITAGQELQVLKGEEEQLFLLEKKRLENLLTIAKGEAKEEQKIRNQIQALDDQHTLKQVQNAKKIADAQKKAATESLQKWHSFFDQVNQNFKTSINGWLQGTQTFGQAMEKLWQGVASAIIEKLLDISLKYIETELLMKVFKIGSEKEKAAVSIQTSAAQAGAAGVASWAGAPWPIDAGAPAFGAAMATAAGAYSAIGIAEKGARLDRDRPIFGHAEELILPRNISRGLTGLIETGSIAHTGGGMGGIHFAPVLHASAMNTDGLEPLLNNFKRQLFRELKGAVRTGRLNFI